MGKRSRTRRVLRTYARTTDKSRGYRWVTCNPSPTREPDGRWAKAKVIFDGADNAAAAARELTDITGMPHFPFVCPYSGRGHYHLTTTLHPACDWLTGG